jgi:mRNA interferase MazF
MERSMKGTVVVVPFPFSDLTGSKRRPALVVADWGGDDIILCQITSRSKKDGFEIQLNVEDFSEGRLPVSSNIRPNKVFTADRRIVLQRTGKLKAIKYKEVAESLIRLIQ